MRTLTILPPKIQTSMILAFIFAEAIAVISLLVIFHLFVR